ncbi:polysaccharide pyruvyl transferase family protein [Octadecabacter sp. 1_MG-2023]|uniref:polysaccharide pyruvyl transferase family protein n=1 Tax=unclassified Octadecabacter TaxID=196158 RepID=UPI001C0885DB|nr:MULTISPECIES: polysaccharide pyruvyl transferase family protein [unclassified Octadecabacter]MBU2993174.1 polysaccharide pyruvyl transferase family protein [Octadecabacter sp. B2R22]MDO6733374.1 polysaccharide pyruvyl transferase family protein [Octadecabacter sp. 1_MG-2023]
MTYSSPLKLFYYNKEQNFGDAISATIVAHVAGRDVVWAGHKNCEMYALGSLMKMVKNNQNEPREKGGKPFIWGTGAMSGIADLSFLKNVRVALLRGPITAALLQRDDRLFGDTGLLIADALGDPPERQDVVGLVPHMHFADDERFAKIAADNTHIKLIDVRNPDPHAVVREIASCSHVISQSLHGLITADAYGIPNTWLDPLGIHGGAMLKFHDYAAGIGRALGTPIEQHEITDVASNAPNGTLPYADGIAIAKEALVESFPDGLKQREAA